MIYRFHQVVNFDYSTRYHVKMSYYSIKGEIQWSGKFHSYDRYSLCEVWENFIFSFFAPWCSEFNFRIQLLTSFKYNPVPQQFVDTLGPL